VSPRGMLLYVRRDMHGIPIQGLTARAVALRTDRERKNSEARQRSGYERAAMFPVCWTVGAGDADDAE